MKFAKYFTDKDIDNVLRLFDKYGLLVVVESNIAKCRDSKDNFLLNLAIDSKADFLLTGDTDLLMLEKIRKTRIVTFGDFLIDLNKSL